MDDHTNEKPTSTKHNPPLVIDLSEEYKIKIEDPDKLKGSFFEEIYLKAADAVDDIIEQPERTPKLEKNDPFLNEKQDYNNIIAFCGERGTGKSSAMISFAQSLLKLKDSQNSKNFYVGKKLITKNFHTIQVIDPSLFEEHENIFEVILAQLFSSFEKELNKKEKDSKLNAKRELLEQFEKVYENLQTIKKNGQKYDGEALETLNKLACGANLRQNFKELVKRYLDFIVGKEEKEEKNNAYLIIPIDDFDLNVKAVAEMAEQIRKYLMIPKVIVLMAANMPQLTEAIEMDFIKKYEKNKFINDSEVKSRTQNYLTKLIPEARRLKLDRDISVTGYKLEVLFNKDDFDFPAVFESNPVSPTSPSLTGKLKIEYHNTRKFIQVLTFYKTGFYSDNIEILVPSRIRDFKEFLIMISKQGNGNYASNLKELKAFYFEKSLNGKLNEWQKEIINSWGKVVSHQKNHFLVNALFNHVKNETEKRLQTKFLPINLIDDNSKISFEISSVLDKKVNERNISLGDILLVMKYYSRNVAIPENDIFFISLKTIYSMEMLRLLHSDDKESLSTLIAGNVYNPIDIKPLRPTIDKTKQRHFYEFQSDVLKYIEKEDDYLIEWLIFFIGNIGMDKKRAIDRTLYRSPLNYRSNIAQATQLEFNVFGFLSTIYYPELQLERIWGSQQEENTYSEKIGISKIDITTLCFFLNIEVIEFLLSQEYTPPKAKISGAFSYHFERFIEKIDDIVSKKYEDILMPNKHFIKNNSLFKFFLNYEDLEITETDSEKLKRLPRIFKLPNDNIIEKKDLNEIEEEYNRINNLLLEKIDRIKEQDYLTASEKELFITRFKISILLNKIFFSNEMGSNVVLGSDQREIIEKVKRKLEKFKKSKSDFDSFVKEGLKDEIEELNVTIDGLELVDRWKPYTRISDRIELIVKEIESKLTSKDNE